MGTAHQVLTAVTLVSIPTVMFGGFSLLRLRAAKRLTEYQASQFRAGHAHAGVLLVMTLAALAVAGQYRISESLTWTLGLLLLVGVLSQSGGMFLNLALGRPGAWSVGNTVTSVGGVLLAAGLLVLGYGVATT